MSYNVDERFDILESYMDYYINFLIHRAIWFGGCLKIDIKINTNFNYKPLDIIDIYNKTGNILYRSPYNDSELEVVKLKSYEPMTLEEWEFDHIKSKSIAKRGGFGSQSIN